jgi:hypothetical protein
MYSEVETPCPLSKKRRHYEASLFCNCLEGAGRGEGAAAEEPGLGDGEQAGGEREGGGQDGDQAQPHGVRPRQAQR